MKLNIPYVLILFLLSVAAQCTDDGSEDYDKAIRYLQSDECEKALEYVNRSIEKDSTNAAYLELKGDIFERKEKYHEAIDFYNKVLDINCELVDVRHKKCKILYCTKDYDQTIACCEATLEIVPTHKESINLENLAEIKIAEMSGKPIRKDDDPDEINETYQEILDSYDEIIEIDNNYSSAWNNKGVLLGTLQMYNDSVACFDEAIRINSSSSSVAVAWNNKGKSMDLLGRDEEALECYNKSIELDPYLAEALHNKCMFLKRVNQPKSEIYFDKANNIDSEMKYQGLLYKDTV